MRLFWVYLTMQTARVTKLWNIGRMVSLRATKSTKNVVPSKSTRTTHRHAFARVRATLTLPSAHSTVRGAMVSVMLAGSSLQHQHRPGGPSPSHSSPGIVGEDAGGVRQAAGERRVTSYSGWSSALAAETRSGAVPRDPSTCILWCAIALGALVRGFPLDQVSGGTLLLHALLRPCSEKTRWIFDRVSRAPGAYNRGRSTVSSCQTDVLGFGRGVSLPFLGW